MAILGNAVTMILFLIAIPLVLRSTNTMLQNDLYEFAIKEIQLITNSARSQFDHLHQLGSSDYEAVYNKLREEKIGESGYIFVFDTSCVMTLHPSSQGKCFLDVKNNQGTLVIKEMRDLAQVSDTAITYHYSWQNPGEESPRMKVATIAYYEPLGLFIGAGSYVDEFYSSSQEINAKLKKSCGVLLLFMLFLTSLLVLLSIMAGNRIGDKIKKINQKMRQFSKGDVILNEQEEKYFTAVSHHSHDEIGLIAQSFLDMGRYFHDSAQSIHLMAAKDYTIPIVSQSPDDKFSQSLEELRLSMCHSLTELKRASDEVNNNITHVADSSEHLSDGATQQAASLEEINSTIVEIREQTNLNAASAKEVNKIAKETSMATIEGNKHMRNMVKSMDRIANASDDVNNIIKLIDDIAFQTNLLALNAAVEAARANQHGKGFAVVADEVRSLANRSAKAVNETSLLLEKNSKEIRRGAEVSKIVEESLIRVSTQVESVNALAKSIAHSSTQQAAAISEISQALNSVDKVTQKNSAVADKTAASSREVQKLTEHLHRLSSSYRICGS